MDNRSDFIMADIKSVFPNPLNPRTDNTIKTDEIQRVIREKGWEVPITCYQKGNQYIILSGHRRWYAAKKLMQKVIPVYLVAPPKSIEEEQERLGSVQGGKSDWSVYEWAKHTHDMWIYWEKCSFSELARKMNKSCTFVSHRVKVFNYYQHSEIEENLKNGRFSISILVYLIKWLENLSKLKPEIIKVLKLDGVRTIMLSKIEKKLVGILDLKNDSFIYKANTEQIKTFLSDSNMKLSDALFKIDSNSIRYRGKSKLKTYINDIDNAKDIITRIDLSGIEFETTKLKAKVDEYYNLVSDLKADLKLYTNS
ncbi:ParB/RepB/Spo0J family partition protein [Paenibacillus cucumis (ex Kampfer et al. 2016)]|uniref:ParB N-terminal domain-containing protein n=1 Tax=Paenibacillus cucumis (ex Kampfer et al. 2016) TaxID=1776858 RepID=A0ABS7KNY2_9BACL|nr:ParB/RepB/Spo0J family partition protein [Paenibacillus cucumis (ex Kampfer et al. 2016)]MBY0205799.1 ParB N-terminal domain-containing protein [Paenibacillus cucumis (ex Kampfer et al. 2016)]